MSHDNNHNPLPGLLPLHNYNCRYNGVTHSVVRVLDSLLSPYSPSGLSPLTQYDTHTRFLQLVLLA